MFSACFLRQTLVFRWLAAHSSDDHFSRLYNPLLSGMLLVKLSREASFQPTLEALSASATSSASSPAKNRLVSIHVHLPGLHTEARPLPSILSKTEIAWLSELISCCSTFPTKLHLIFHRSPARPSEPVALFSVSLGPNTFCRQKKSISLETVLIFRQIYATCPM